MDALKAALLLLIRTGLLIVPLVALFSGHPEVHFPNPWFPDWFPNAWYPDITTKNFLFRIVVEVVLAAWVVVASMDARYRPKFSGSVRAFAVFVGVMLVANLFGQNPSQSLWSNFERMRGWVSQLHLLGYLVVLVSVFDERRHWRWMFLLSLAVSAFIALLAIMQYLATAHDWSFSFLPDHAYRLHNQKPDAFRFRADARLGNPVYLGHFFMTHLFVAALWLLRQKRWVTRIPYVAVAVLLALGMWMTRTRSAYAGALLGALTVILVAGLCSPNRRVRLFAVATPVVVLGLLFLTVALFVTFKPEWVYESPSLRRLPQLRNAGDRRFWLYEMALQGWLERPLLGWGDENFQYLWDKYYDPRMVYSEMWYDHPHNSFLGWLVAGGVIGLAAYAYFVLVPFHQLWRGAKARLTAGERAVLTGGLLAHLVFVMWMFDSLTSDVVLLTMMGYIHWAATGAERSAGRALGPVGAVAVLALAATAAGIAIEKINLENWRVATSLAQPPVMRLPDGRADWAIRDVLTMDTFAKREVREHAITLASDPELRETYPEAALRDLEVMGEEAMLRQLEDTRRAPLSRSWLMLYALYWEKQDWEKAVHALREALALAPRRQLYLMELGKTYRLMGRHEEAIAAFREASVLLSSYPDPKVGLAIVAIESGDHALESEMMELLHSEARPPRELAPELAEAMVRAGRFEQMGAIYARLVGQAEERMGSRRWQPLELFRRYEALAWTMLYSDPVGREAQKTLNKGRNRATKAAQRLGLGDAATQEINRRAREANRRFLEYQRQRKPQQKPPEQPR
ncbi:MAG: O-antigen ligase family protein [Planctomycetota bacterium]